MSSDKGVNFAEGTIFLVCQVIFCLAFIASCEVPNWVAGPRSPNQCVDRWMFAAALFVPSGIQSGIGSKPPTSRTRRHTDT